MEVPKLKRGKGLRSHYTVCVTPELKRTLVELKDFEEVDVPDWIRRLIEENVEEFKKSLKNQK